MRKNDGRDSEELNTVDVFRRKLAEARQDVKHHRLEINDIFHQVRVI